MSSGVGDSLAAINASMNLAATLLLVAAYVAIRRRQVRWHRRLMLAALGCSAVFLAGYLTRMLLTGVHRFPEAGWIKTGYLMLLGSHVGLAIVLVPLLLQTLRLALQGHFHRHRAWAKITFPIWLYVSVTGVVVFAMLYGLAPALVQGGLSF